jgi:teichuronic acid biosynthesis glycosyltransferase TuaG
MVQTMQDKYLVSVIVPCLNSEKTIAQTIDSVLSQDYHYLELIIIDDGSSDSSLEIINKYLENDSRVTLLRNTECHGVANARNMGIRFARGKYICFLDSDDYLIQGSIGLRVRTAVTKNAKIVYGNYLRLLHGGKVEVKAAPLRITLGDMLRRNYIGNLTGMYDAEALGKKFQKQIRHEDYLMWCELLMIEKYAQSVGNIPIAVYRVSLNSLSGNKFKAFLWHWDVLRNGLSINLLACSYYQLYYFITSLFDRFIYQIKRWIK